jgi:hypothetical protein
MGEPIRNHADDIIINLQAMAALKGSVGTIARIAAEEMERLHNEADVRRFAEAMILKLHIAHAKGRHGWRRMPSPLLWKMLREHVDKGNPVDVANLAMMIHSNEAR